MNSHIFRIGTDCSGIEAPIQALMQLRIPFRHVWSCDNDKFVKKSIYANYEPELFYDDITTRNHSELPDVDIYVCGFPCQSFSLMGNKKGTRDPRGLIMNHCIEVITKKLPKVFILENVKNFKHIDRGQAYKYLLSKLNNLQKYNIYPDIYNTRDYGIPQNRERLYIIGIRRDIQTKTYTKPEKIEMDDLENYILDKTIYENEPCQTIAYKIKNTHEEIFIINDNFTNPSKFYTPTLTASSCGYVYSTLYKRYLTHKECLLLQGFPVDFKQVVSKTQLLKQIGNSMSVNVLKVIFIEILNCIKLLAQHEY